MELSRQGIFFVLSSPSGGGKTTIYKGVIRQLPGITYSVSYTTRAARENEIDGHDYNFVTLNTFEMMRAENQFMEWAEVHDALYGTHRETLLTSMKKGIDVIMDIDVQGARQLRQKMKQGIFIFIFPPTMGELERRLRNRKSDTDATIRRRLDIARIEMSVYKHYDYLVINDSLEQAIADVITIIKAERCKISRFDNHTIKKFFQLPDDEV
ncbi:guanylate kinase [candidate division CSSED10-310 bacterium]|uniref:Guanylate kinase n=1 Tax=candidate division CSSED10-310 bacterium TaxID=2855610 RepID=A0ABV6YV21_UNCC1